MIIAFNRNDYCVKTQKDIIAFNRKLLLKRNLLRLIAILFAFKRKNYCY